MAYLVTIAALVIFFAMHQDRMKDPAFVAPALIAFPMVVFMIRKLLWPMIGPKVEEVAEERKEEPVEEKLPEATYQNWKADLEKMVTEEMSMDEFLDRWRGRGPNRKMKELEAAKAESPSVATKKVREMFEQFRKKMST